MQQAEAVIVERYPQLVRLAYLSLPTSLDRHSRVLRAHRAVQQALRSAGRGSHGGRTGGSTGPGTEDRPDTLTAVRAEVVRRVAGPGRPPLPLPPWVWGLRMWPAAEGLDEIARTLAPLTPAGRAAHVLCRLDGLDEPGAVRILEHAGIRDAAAAVRAALAVPTAPADTTAPTGEAGPYTALPHPTALDAAAVNTRPSDLLRRRNRVRAVWAATGVLVLAAVLGRAAAGGGPDPTASGPYAGSPAARTALDPARLVRVPAQAWSDTGRVDFTAWPARGSRTGDSALLTRALGTWAAPPEGTAVTVSPATPAEPPVRPPHLLYAGDADGPAGAPAGASAVVLLDGDRIVRYVERDGRRRSLDISRVDDAGVTTAAALTLGRTGDTARQLLAPWIATAAERDLGAPAEPVRTLPIDRDGTVLARVPRTDGPCGSRPVLEVASSARIVEKHSFLLADLGGLLPVHLTYTPLAEGAAAVPARQPREATGAAALERWAQEACTLQGVDARAVRSVNLWDFAAADLPENSGRAVWSCSRATHWSGQGDVEVRLRPAGGSSVPVARARATAACGRFGQHVLAGTVWSAPSGRPYLLAAGSREVAEIDATGPVRAHASGRSLTAQAPAPAPAPAPAARPALTARLHSGAVITALDGDRGGRD
ncbi:MULTISPECIES: hypothetical protein [Streptomyces]|uniref:hypothetical protein n=1 Tax=Streptomyces TaxID=1883 RepID=UPI00069F67BD|nr:hypothetical protein [Streptomyces virginiae]